MEKKLSWILAILSFLIACLWTGLHRQSLQTNTFAGFAVQGGSLEQKAEIYRRLLKEYPADSNLHEQLAAVYRKMGRFEESSQHQRTAENLQKP